MKSMPAQTKQIALCIDDFALHEGIDQACYELLALGRVSAISCMSNAPRWRSASQQLCPFIEHADIGLHFNLTQDFGEQRGASLLNTISRAYFNILEPEKIRCALQQQLDLFEQSLQRAPDFIDGHQHIHQLPQIRDVILETLEQRYPNSRMWVRNTVSAQQMCLGKPLVLNLLGGYHFKNLVKQSARKTNRGFAGVYDLASPNYAAYFATWLSQVKHGALVMCHPASLHDANDSISQQRLIEFEFFKSAQFLDLLAQHATTIVPLSRI